MSGKFNGTQAKIKDVYPHILFSPCAAHSLNLLGQDCAKCCVEAVTFFGSMQSLYNIFSASPKRWEILKRLVGSSLHTLSKTRWAERVDSVRPIAANLPSVCAALKEVLLTNLTLEVEATVRGLVKYVSSFKCVLLAAIWTKLLMTIDRVNLVLQAKETTLDVEVANLEMLEVQITELEDRCALQSHRFSPSMFDLRSICPSDWTHRAILPSVYLFNYDQRVKSKVPSFTLKIYAKTVIYPDMQTLLWRPRT